MRSILQNEMKGYVSPSIQIDSHKAKLGNDEDVCVLKFESNNKEVAKDLVQFVESGRKFVLDADHSPSKNNQGKYDIFVEVERNDQLPNNIIDLARDIEKATGMLPWEFKFYKNEDSYKLTLENIGNQIPTSPSEYNFLTNDSIDEDIKSFFESSDVKRIKRVGKNLTLHKTFSKHNFVIEGLNVEKVLGIYQIDTLSENQSTYIKNWLGDAYKVVRVEDLFKITNDNKNILLRTKEI